MSTSSYDFSDEDDDFPQEEQKMMREKEEYLVENVSPCLESKLEVIKNNFYSLKDTVFQKAISESFYNTNVMKVAECTISSLFYVSPNDFGSLSLNDKITTYIRNLRKIGGPSLEGNAFLADFGKSQDLFVVKSAKNIHDDSLIHELVIGLYGTNQLRKFVPNFSYIYGGFKCSPPLLSDTKALSWCNNNDNKVNYVLYENINPSMSLNQFLSRCSGADFLNVYMQILYALRKAYLFMDYTHYDLHTENVLIRGTDYPRFQIPYETEKLSTEYIQSNVVGTLIDYGYSHFLATDMIAKDGSTIPADYYGVFGLEEYQVYPMKSWVVGDMYKLLMMSMEKAQNYKNNSVMGVGRIIYSYFFENDMLIGLEQGKEKYQTLAFRDDYDQKFVLDDLAKYIRSRTDCSFISRRTELPVLNCETLMCDTEEIIYKKVGLSSQEELIFPTDILEFVILYERLHNERRFDEVEVLVSGYDYGNSSRISIGKLDLHVKEVIDDLKVIEPASIKDVATRGKKYLLKVKQMYFRLIEVFNKIRKIKILYTVCLKAGNIYKNRKSLTDIQNIIGNFLVSSDKILYDLMSAVDGNRASKIVSEYQWYDVDRKSFDQLINKEYGRYQSIQEEYIRTTLEMSSI